MQSGSCFTHRNYKKEMSQKLTKKYLSTIRRMAYVESAITHHPGSTQFKIEHLKRSIYLCLREGDDDEEEEEDDSDDCADVFDDESALASRFHDKLFRHLSQDRNRSEPLALAGGHLGGRIDDFTECRIPSTVRSKIRIPPDTLADLDTESFHV